MGAIGKLCAFIATELALLVTPMMFPTIPFEVGLGIYALAGALLLFAVAAWLRDKWFGPAGAAPASGSGADEHRKRQADADPRGLGSPGRVEREKLAEIMAQERVRVAEEVERIRMFVLFQDWTDEEIKTVFHGSERPVNKFWSDRRFRELWEAFHASVVEFAAKQRKLAPAKRFGRLPGLVEYQEDRNRRPLDTAAEAVIAHILRRDESG